MRGFRIITSMVLALVMSISGVYAVWNYASNATAPVDNSINSNMNEFVYKPFKGVYIKNVEVVGSSGVTVISNGFEKPTFHITSTDPARSGGYVTYKITFHNTADVTQWFIGVNSDSDYGENTLVGLSSGITLKCSDHESDSASTFDSEDWIPSQTERDVYVTYTYGASAQGECETNLDFHFGVRMDAVHDEFLAVLNNVKIDNAYQTMVDAFNTQYAKNGKTTITTESHPEIFAMLFDDLMVDIDGIEKRASVVIRRENLDKDTTSGDDYSGSGPVGCEYTLYITVESLTPGTSPTVYAIAYSFGASGMGNDWYQVGELYEGTAPIKADGTIDYANWKANYKTYQLADGIEYIVGAANGDQYDIMNTMEQLISAVDQDIFNQIDNTNIFKKVYDIIKKHPNSDDPAVVGLSHAFEDAAKFYRNFNNGQEFKVVRDKYTRAEIIYALQNIQKALDYYYQAFPE